MHANDVQCCLVFPVRSDATHYSEPGALLPLSFSVANMGARTWETGFVSVCLVGAVEEQGVICLLLISSLALCCSKQSFYNILSHV